MNLHDVQDPPHELAYLFSMYIFTQASLVLPGAVPESKFLGLLHRALSVLGETAQCWWLREKWRKCQGS